MKYRQAALILIIACSFSFAGPGPGDVFREYTYRDSVHHVSFNECSPAATAGFCRDYQKQIPRLLHGVDLNKAVRAKVDIAWWSGHIGTAGKRNLNSSRRRRTQ